MTHEFKKLLSAHKEHREKGARSVLATVVALDGSSYRRPGVRMLLGSDGSMTGAVSGGCVEKEVLLQAQSVFETGLPKVMTYDGRYRLGCEGILYILLEPFDIEAKLQESFNEAFEHRKRFVLRSLFRKQEEQAADFFTLVEFADGRKATFRGQENPQQREASLSFEQEMSPLFRMIIIGAEHDAVQLCSAAALLGWEVSVIASPKDPRTKTNFPGAAEVLHLEPEAMGELKIDKETAMVLMTHNYARDLKFLLAIKEEETAYIGLLGAMKRRERLFNEIIEKHPEVSGSFLDRIYGPAGLHIGAETPQEIAVSIIAEILSVTRRKEPFGLREKTGAIHK